MGALRRSAARARTSRASWSWSPAHRSRPADLAPVIGRAASCPSRFQGVQFQPTGRSRPLPRTPAGVSAERAARRHRRGGDASTSWRWSVSPIRRSQRASSSTRLAFRMQTSVPELTDFSDEPKSVLDLYGVEPGAAAPSRPTACSPAAWPSAASASFSSTTAAGTITAASRPA